MIRFEKTDGFSLVELLTVIAIVGIMATFALPSFISGIPGRRLKSAARDLYGAMQQARLLAVQENANISLIFGEDFYYIDEDLDGAYDADERRVDLSKYHDVQFVIGSVPSLGTSEKLSRIGAASNVSSSSVTFTPTGTATSYNDQNTAYIQNINDKAEIFAIGVMNSGSVKISWYDGNETWK